MTGCRVHLIAPYDAQLDQTMTQVQQDTEVFFGQMEAVAGGAAAGYAANTMFYVKTEATLRTLLTRAQAVPKEQAVAAQILAIESTVERLQKMHERDVTLNAENLAITRGLLESEFRSFFGLETVLKSRVGTPPNGALAPATTRP